MKMDKILVDFFNEKLNREHYERYLEQPTLENKRILDKQFKKHFYMVRCFSYFLKMVHYESRHFDKKQREHNKRYQLTLDRQDENGRPEIDFISNKYIEKDCGSELYEVIESNLLLNALMNLTNHQSNILNKIYVGELKDGEIAKVLGISQQAVTKTKRGALNKLKKEMLKNVN